MGGWKISNELEREEMKKRGKKTKEEERENENRGRTFWKTNRKNPTSFRAAKIVNNNYVKAINSLQQH